MEAAGIEPAKHSPRLQRASDVEPPPAGLPCVNGHRVALWGRVVEHEVGWRAQFAYPIAVTLYDDGLLANADKTATLARRVAAEYAIEADRRARPEHWQSQPPQVFVHIAASLIQAQRTYAEATRGVARGSAADQRDPEGERRAASTTPVAVIELTLVGVQMAVVSPPTQHAERMLGPRMVALLRAVVGLVPATIRAVPCFVGRPHRYHDRWGFCLRCGRRRAG